MLELVFNCKPVQLLEESVGIEADDTGQVSPVHYVCVYHV